MDDEPQAQAPESDASEDAPVAWEDLTAEEQAAALAADPWPPYV